MTEQQVVPRGGSSEMMMPAGFLYKIQPCQAIDGGEAKFECTFIGDPQPTITWYRDNKVIKPSNLYQISTNQSESKSTLRIKQVNLKSNAVFTVKAENPAGAAKSSANLVVVEAMPSRPGSSRGGVASSPTMLTTASSTTNNPAVSPTWHSANWVLDAHPPQGTGRVYGSELTVSSPLPSANVVSSTTNVVTTTSTASSSGGLTSAHDQFARSHHHQNQYHEDRSRLTSDISERSASATGSGQLAVESVHTRRLSPNETASLIIRSSPVDGSMAPTCCCHTIHGSVGGCELVRLDVQFESQCSCECHYRSASRTDREDQNLLLTSSDQSTSYRKLEQSHQQQQQQQQQQLNYQQAGRSQANEASRRQQYLQSQSQQQQQQLLMRQQQQQQQKAQFQQQQQTIQSTSTKQRVETTKQQVPSGGEFMIPEFLTHIQDFAEKNEGDSVHFECFLSPFDDPDLKTEWFFNGKPLVTGSRFHTIDDFGFIVLDIDWLFPRDSGEYICRASNKYGTDITRTVLKVKPNKNIVLDSQLDNAEVTMDKLRQLDFPEVQQKIQVDKQEQPAHFVQHLISRNNQSQFKEGDSVHFRGRVGPAEDGNLSVEWFHNDKPLISGHRFRPTFDFGLITMDILYVYPEDSGVYKCVVRNKTGTDVSQFEIKVSGRQTIEYHSQLPQEMIVNMPRQRAANPQSSAPPSGARSAPPPSYLSNQQTRHQENRETWSWSSQRQRLIDEDSPRGTQLQQEQQPRPMSTTSGSESQSQQKQEQYSQILEQERNKQQQQQAVGEEFQTPPQFMTHIQDYVEKNEGDSVHFECCLTPVDDPDLKTEWFFNGRPLVTGSRFHTIDDFGFIVLDIDWLFPRDTGEYICKATNKYGTDITRTVLRVKPDKNIVLDSQLENADTTIDKLRQLEFPDVAQEVYVEEPNKPAHFVQPLKSKNNQSQFTEGDKVHFRGRVGPTSDGNLNVEWFHNDKPLISGHRFRPTFDFGLITMDILYVYPEDSGVYKCVAKNNLGSDVSQIEIHVTGKQSIVYQSQLPKEMIGGVQKLNEMEAMWNRPPDPEEDEAPAERAAPQFVLKPKPCVAFEGSCARFCCRIIGHPRPRLTWSVNGQNVVTGSRYKLTHDGMYHLIIPKCQLSDAGKIEVHAKNPLGECYATTELKVKRKVDDYRGVLKNSPNPWYDEATLKMYRRQRSMDLTEDDDDYEFFEKFRNQQQQLRLQISEQQALSPSQLGQQVIGYMEPGTPDVNLLARSNTPLVEPGDLHPVVMEQQVVMAPAPSTIQRALNVKDSIKPAEMSFDQDTSRRSGPKSNQQADASSSSSNQRQDLTSQNTRQADASTSQSQAQSQAQAQDGYQNQESQSRVFGVNMPRQQANNKSLSGAARSQPSYLANQQARLQEAREQSNWSNQKQVIQDSTGVAQSQEMNAQRSQQQSQQQHQQQQHRLSISSTSSSLLQGHQFDPRLPPPSPESVVHGKEVHSQTHKQTQLERRANKEIVREIIEKEIFEQEHKGVTKDNMIRGTSVERGFTPTEVIQSRQDELRRQQLQQQQQHGQFQQQQVGQQSEMTEQQVHQVLIEEFMTPPEFVHKIQPCQAIDGDEAKFECTFIGDPQPTITWYRDNKQIKPSNMYQIVTDSGESKSTLIIKRVTLNSNAVFTVKAENVAGSAKSSANLVVEPHPLPGSSRGGVARQFGDGVALASSMSGNASATSSSVITTSATTTTATSDHQSHHQDDHNSIISDTSESASGRAIKSVRTRRLSPDEMASLIRASPEGLIAPAFLHTIHETVGKVGELVRLDVRLLGTQPFKVRWLRDGQRVRVDQNHKLLLEGDQYTYLILECSQQDEGFYECVVTNRVGEARCGATLQVITGDGRLSALSGGHQTPDMMAASNLGMMSRSSESPSFSMSSSTAATTTETSGQKLHYGLTKHQYNPLMSQYTTTEAGLQRMDQIPKLIKRLENQQVREGKPVVLRCQISSYPPVAEVNWYRESDKKLIKPSKYFRLYKDNEETYCLKILETFPEDQGEYKCVAKAPNGYVETKATITVIPNSPK